VPRWGVTPGFGVIAHSGWVLVYAIGLHFVLAALPVAAGALLAARAGARSLAVRLAAGLATGGVAALLAFWAYYWHPAVGTTFSWLLILGSVAVVAASFVTDRLALRSLATAIGLWGTASTFLLGLGFAHGGTEDAFETASRRFSGPLPSDNEIPSYFAEWYYRHGHETPPVFGTSWLSSDRPPLQVGYLLSQRPFFSGAEELHYQVLGTVLQQQWVLGLYALLIAAGVSRLTRAGALVAVLLFDVVFVNGFFVWPKLLPAAMLLAIAALVLTPQWRSIRRRTSGAALVAVLAGLAMMGHGSSAFALVGIGLVVAFRGLPRLRWLAAAAVIGAVLVLPWSGYQKWADPPGDRLIKWHLAGQQAIDRRGAGETIVDEYRELGWKGAFEHKLRNVSVMLGPAQVPAALQSGEPVDSLIAIRRVDAFFHLVPALGLLLLGPLSMLVTRRYMDANDRRFALTAFAASATASLAACLLLFGGPQSNASVHVCSLLAPLLAAAGSVAALTALGRHAAIGWLGTYSVIQLAVYVPVLEPDEGSAWSAKALILAGVALIAYVWLAVRGSGDVDAAEEMEGFMPADASPRGMSLSHGP
jgi:hypothetical protein